MKCKHNSTPTPSLIYHRTPSHNNNLLKYFFYQYSLILYSVIIIFIKYCITIIVSTSSLLYLEVNSSFCVLISDCCCFYACDLLYLSWLILIHSKISLCYCCRNEKVDNVIVNVSIITYYFGGDLFYCYDYYYGC